MGVYQPRLYREGMNAERFSFFSSVYMESDLLIGLPRREAAELWSSMQVRVLDEQKRLHSLILDFERTHPGFTSAMEPLDIKRDDLVEVTDAFCDIQYVLSGARSLCLF